ncbi:FAD-dependent oxidoreductase [Sphingomonas sp. 28-63-12]|uniref:FAD-dependent oxidoreductase n=1 Tax=Sphingomonas sp. 28-63-12 TaxID=1970434 RepID=UPI000BDC4A54|nr:MAG: FAD-binding dehydrogenase [Sphingomonas sp. 28-63-12]
MSYDVIVIGSGGAGLTAAVTAAHKGLKVLVLEKMNHFGGTTAVSGGGVWIPGNRHAMAAGIVDPVPVARQYILDAVGEGVRPELVDAYLGNGPAMIDFLAGKTQVNFVNAPPSWDWYPDIPGARDTGRLLAICEYDGKKLGKAFADLTPARTEFNAPGGFMIDLFDLPHLAGIGKSLTSTLYMGKLVLRFLADRLRGYPRGTRLTMGNALAARLIRSALDAGVELRKSVSVAGLQIDHGRVSGVTLPGGETVLASKGVVLATGGWSMNPQLRKAYMPFADDHVSIMQAGSTGDGMNLALDNGAVVDGVNHGGNGVWAVVSTLKREDGSLARYAHLIDMAKPGCIAVNARGERFGNEASPMFAEAMHKTASVPAWLVADASFVKSYGLGMVFPGGGGLKKLLAAGYIVEAPTLAALAAKIGIDATGLATSVAQVNRDAPGGIDTGFAKGATAIDREMGDPVHAINPCFGSCATAPFYAVKIFPGDGSSTVGLRIDARMRVLDGKDAVIGGLYAVGLDANSIWRGRSPAHGCNIGPAMVTGYVAGCTLAT